MSTYRAHALKIHVAGSSAVVIRDIISQNLTTEADVRAEVTAENYVPDHIAIVAENFRHAWASYDLVQLLDTIGLTGLCISTDVSHPGVVGYLQKFDDCGVAASGSVNRSLTYALGLVVPRRITCDHRSDARMDFDVVVLGDGTNAPVVLADNVALPTISASPTRFTLGPIKLKDVALSQYSSIEIDFGNTVTPRGVESNLRDTVIEQKTHEPSITIRGIDPTWFSSSKIPIGGAVIANSTDYLFLRKRAQTASHFVADGTAEHIKFTPAGFAHASQPIAAEMNRVNETTLVIKGAKDSSGNMPLVVDTTAAIS